MCENNKDRIVHAKSVEILLFCFFSSKGLVGVLDGC